MDGPEINKEAPDGMGSRLLNWLRAADGWLGERARSERARSLLVGSLITLTLGILAWSVYRNWDTLTAFEWQFDPWYLGVSFLCCAVALWQGLFVWHRMMGRLAGLTDLGLNAKLYVYSLAAKRLPGFVWYIGSRLYLYQQEAVPKTITSVGLLLELTLQILSGILVFLGMMPFSELDLLGGGSAWFFLGTIPLLVLVLWPSLLIRLLNAVLPRLGRPPLELQIRRKDSLLWVAQYAVGWVIMGLSLYYLTWAIHPLPTSALPGVVGIVVLTTVLRLIVFVIPGGWGLQEVSLSLGLSPYVPLPVALGISLLYRLWLTFHELVWITICPRVLNHLERITRKY